MIWAIDEGGKVSEERRRDDLDGLTSSCGSLESDCHELTDVEERLSIPHIDGSGPELGSTGGLTHAHLMLIHEGVGPLDQGKGVRYLRNVAQDLWLVLDPSYKG
jgi:hypothetical protein